MSDTSHDEELAKQLQQQEIAVATGGAGAGVGAGAGNGGRRAPPTAAAAQGGAPGGTFVQLPSDSAPQRAPQAQDMSYLATVYGAGIDDGEERESEMEREERARRRVTVAMSSPEDPAIEMAKAEFLVKLIAVVTTLYYIYSVILRAWWLLFSFGIFMGPVGFFGAHKHLRLPVLAFDIYLCVDLLIQLFFPFVAYEVIGAMATLMCMVFIVLQGFSAVFVYQFSKKLVSSRSGMRTMAAPEQDV
eukprot:TRINITY_DN2956_c0_g2_i1.p1 TRINITY_DN2956_c0_g2~~TRINITY_DN2956_c0_g2_i1.p1  ORF type:complete len:245 (+),score=71.68 TRINITY_DN2956_c0_g2_i1:47-781(+)